MTYGSGPPPSGWQPSGDDSDPPTSRGRRRAQPPDATSAWYPQAEPSDPSSRRFPSPPPPARHLGRPNNSGAQPLGYPAYPPPVPTSPTVPRPTSPRPPGPRQDATGTWGPPRSGAPSGGFSGGGMPPRGGPRPFAGPAGPGTLPRPVKPGPKRPGGPPRRGLPPLPADPAVPKSVLIRNAVPGLIRHLPHHKPWMIALSVIAVVVVLSTCGLGSFLLFRDDQKLTAQAEPTPTVPTRDISTRQKDSALMTPADVFPNKEITADAAVPPYKQIGDAQVNADCRAGATGDLGKLLVAKGCDQIIRATFSSTDGHYLVTAGILNLLDATSASQAVEQIRGMDPSTGRFTGYITTADTKVIGRSATQVGWESEGHFLIYCVIARADGQDLATNDPMIRVIVYDMVEKYLRDTVVYNWSIDRSSAAPSAGASGSPSSPSP